MSGLWLDLLGRAWQLIAAGFICAVVVGIWAGPGDEYSCAPTEDEADEFDGDAWDRGHDEYVDRAVGL